MADDRDSRLEAEELEAERKLRASVHRWMGTIASLLVLAAIGVAFYRITALNGENMVEVGAWQALKASGPLFAIVLVILGLGVLFSMGTTRVMLGLEKLVNRIKGTKAGR